MRSPGTTTGKTRLAKMPLVAATRDASWLNCPNVSSPKKIHIVGADGFSMCGRIFLDDTNEMNLEFVPPVCMCGRQACWKFFKDVKTAWTT